MKRINIITFLFFLNISFCIAQDGIVYYEYTDAIGVGGAEGEIYNAYTIYTKDKSYYVVAKDSLENAISMAKAKSHIKIKMEA